MDKEQEKVIELVNVKKIYRMGKERIHAVDDVSFDIKKGEFCCLLGTSGSGKSTLLNLMAGIEKASGGRIIIKGKNIPKMSENQLAKFRQRYLGFVFQSYNLINSMTALENVEFPLVFKRIRPKKRRRMAKDILTKVGLGSRLAHKPKEMSGGQQQRVGIARAFVAKPEIVFADEPTGNLDTRTTIEVMELIKKMAKDNNQTIVMVTHDRSLAAYADKIIHILDGKIQSIEIPDRDEQEDLQTQLQEVSKRLLQERGGEISIAETDKAADDQASSETLVDQAGSEIPSAEGDDVVDQASGETLGAEGDDVVDQASGETLGTEGDDVVSNAAEVDADGAAEEQTESTEAVLGEDTMAWLASVTEEVEKDRMPRHGKDMDL